jgi:hypothetical protein
LAIGTAPRRVGERVRPDRDGGLAPARRRRSKRPTPATASEIRLARRDVAGGREHEARPDAGGAQQQVSIVVADSVGSGAQITAAVPA